MDDLTGANDFPEELQKLFFETPMLLFEVYYFKNIHWFQTDLQQVCGFLQRTNDKTALREYVKANEEVFSKLEEDTFDLLTVMSGIRAMKLIKRDVETVGGEFDMCKAFDDMMRDSKQEGIREGRREGERKTEERMNTGALGGLIVLAITPFVMKFASLNDTAMHYLKYMLLINTYYIMGSAVNTALIAGVFRAGGDTKFGLICDTVDMWVYAVPLGFFAAFVLKLPVLWVYFLLCTDEFVKWPWVFHHYRKGEWAKNITREDIFEQ